MAAVKCWRGLVESSPTMTTFLVCESSTKYGLVLLLTLVDDFKPFAVSRFDQFEAFPNDLHTNGGFPNKLGIGGI